jgi:penicillin-binding protein 1A
MKRFVILGGLLVVVLAVAAACTRVVAAQDCPSVAELRTYRPPEASRVFAMDGSLLADLSPQRRVVLELREIPEIVREGFVAVEDRRFWSHGGIDYRGVARAVWRDLRSLSLQEGFSTIPMQLARQVFPEELPMSRKIGRKACEVVLARQIESAFTKRDILELYLNQIYLGSGRYGVEAAAQGYFGKPVREVSLAEAALLVGLVKSPEGFNPRRHPEKAIARRNVVLSVLEREGVITAADGARARQEPLRLTPPPESATPAPYLVAAIRKEIRDRFGPEADVAGLRIHTGLDPRLQKAAQTHLLAQIRRVEAGEFGRYRHEAAPAGGLPPASGSGSPYLQGMVVALDPRTGEVRALVGGRDFTHSSYDRAFQAQRQPGSAFKPIVYAAALAEGLPITSRFETTPVVLAGAGTTVWTPEDHVGDSIASLGLREAMARSSNHAAVRVGQWVGEERVARMGRSLGLSTRIPPYPSIHLGAAEVVPVELVAAYAAFANGGFKVQPQLITRVEDARGKVLWRATASNERVIDEGVAFLTLSLLQEVVDRGTGGAVRRQGFWLPAAGKTGTTNGAKDAWFVGMTPDLVAGVWLGFDRPATILPNASGGGLAAPVWGALMKDAYASRPAPAGWTPPASLRAVPIDVNTGRAATRNCPPEDIHIEYFLSGTEPQEYCPLHPESAAERAVERFWRGLRRVF